MPSMEVFGAVVGAVQLTQVITDTLKALSRLKGQLGNADLTIRSLISELSTMKSAINQIDDLCLHDSDAVNHPEYRQNLSVAVDGCKTTMDILLADVSELADSISYDSNANLGLKERLKIVLGDDRMKDNQKSLRDQISALNLLLQAYQWYVILNHFH